jgi:predicted enzyme related to lactoylglutathione lyase
MSDVFKTHGAFSWLELLTTDPAAAKAFYADLLGWEVEDDAMGMGGYQVVKVGGQAVGGMMEMPAEAPPGIPPHWGVYVTVDDVDATAAKAEALGGKVLRPPSDIPGIGRFAVVADPQGAFFCVIKYAMEEQA